MKINAKLTFWIGMCASAMLIMSRGTPALAATGNEKPNAAEAPKVNGGDSSSRADAKPAYTTYTNLDASHEGLGRQMYVIDISHMLDNPPHGRNSSP